VSREPDFDEIVGGEPTGADRERLRHAHDLLLQAGPPPELTPQLRKGPNVGLKGPSFGVIRLQQRRKVKQRALLLLAAALSIGLVFAAGYAVGGRSKSSGGSAVALIGLKGTASAPQARATLEVWQAKDGNWPMTLSVKGLPEHARYEVYLVRDGKPWGSCGTFRVAGSSQLLTLRLVAPYSLRKGDTWIVTRQTAGGGEPGQTVLRPVPVTA
jgi:hypothetical protein